VFTNLLPGNALIKFVTIYEYIVMLCVCVSTVVSQLANAVEQSFVIS
jgi:hypothetical protein